MTLSVEQRRALEILADAGSRGSTLDMLIENGFPAELLADLVSDGLATMHGETVKVGGRPIEVIRVLITDAGRRAQEILWGAPLLRRAVICKADGSDPVPSWASRRPPLICRIAFASLVVRGEI
jgi:hypothetical protein